MKHRAIVVPFLQSNNFVLQKKPATGRGKAKEEAKEEAVVESKVIPKPTIGSIYLKRQQGTKIPLRIKAGYKCLIASEFIAVMSRARQGYKIMREFISKAPARYLDPVYMQATIVKPALNIAIHVTTGATLEINPKRILAGRKLQMQLYISYRVMRDIVCTILSETEKGRLDDNFLEQEHLDKWMASFDGEQKIYSYSDSVDPSQEISTAFFKPATHIDACFVMFPHLVETVKLGKGEPFQERRLRSFAPAFKLQDLWTNLNEEGPRPEPLAHWPWTWTFQHSIDDLRDGRYTWTIIPQLVSVKREKTVAATTTTGTGTNAGGATPAAATPAPAPASGSTQAAGAPAPAPASGRTQAADTPAPAPASGGTQDVTPAVNPADSAPGVLPTIATGVVIPPAAAGGSAQLQADQFQTPLSPSQLARQLYGSGVHRLGDQFVITHADSHLSDMTPGDTSTVDFRRGARPHVAPTAYNPTTGQTTSGKIDRLLKKETCTFEQDGKEVEIELYHSDYDDDFPSKFETNTEHIEFCGQVIKRSEFFEQWQRLQETNSDFLRSDQMPSTLKYYMEDDKPFVDAANKDDALKDVQRTFGVLYGMLNPTPVTSAETKMRRGETFNEFNGIMQSMLKFLYCYVMKEKCDMKEALTDNPGVVHAMLEEEQKKVMDELEKKRILPPFRHLENVPYPYNLVGSESDLPVVGLDEDPEERRGLKFWDFLCKHPKLFQEYKDFRYSAGDKNFEQDAQRYKDQQEELEKKPKAGPKRTGESLDREETSAEAKTPGVEEHGTELVEEPSVEAEGTELSSAKQAPAKTPGTKRSGESAKDKRPTKRSRYDLRNKDKAGETEKAGEEAEGEPKPSPEDESYVDSVSHIESCSTQSKSS